MTHPARAERVGELIRQEIGKLIAKGLKDPRIGFVSIMGVKMSPDVKYADVYVSLYGPESERKSSLIALQRGAGWMRREIGKVIRLRYTPELRFHSDETLDEVYHLEEIFKQIHEVEAHAPMLRIDLPAILEELQRAETILITAHTNPDGDAIGSMLGLYHLLRSLGKDQVTCAIADPVPEVYRFLSGADRILGLEGTIPETAVTVLVDCATLERVGEMAERLSSETRLLVIDHHAEEEPEGDAGFLDPTYAATGEIVAEMYVAAGVPLSREAAECLYAAQATDTGGYRYSNTNARSHRIAAQLHDAGIDAAGIIHRVYEVMSRPKFELLRRVLDRMQLSAGARLASSYVTQEDLVECGAKKEDLDGLVNFARNIEGVQVGALFNAVAPNRTKVSLRSYPGFNSAKFLTQFGGGGHAAAAGATIEQPREEVQPMIVRAAEDLLGEGA
jgi:phosphoesterase RecJ-like protein